MEPVNFKLGQRLQVAVSVLIAFLLVGFCWPSVSLLIKIYEREPDYSHGFLVPFVSAYATMQIWKETNLNQIKPSWLGIPFFFLGIAIVIFGYWYYIALFPAGLGYGFVLASGLFVCVTGLYAILGGISMIRICFFPIIYLIFAIPFPKSITLPFTLWLRSHVSGISENLIRGIGITVFREGNVLYLANASLGVEDACSGIRSFWILMAGAAALAFVLRIKPGKAIFLCILSLPISLTMNVLRIVLTALTVSRFGPKFASGWRHDMFGWMTFILGLAILICISLFLSKKPRDVHPQKRHGEKEKAHNEMHLKGSFLFSSLSLLHLFVVTILLTLGASANHLISSHYDDRDIDLHENRKPFSNFPDRIGGYIKFFDGALYDRHLDLLQPSDYLVRHYRLNNEPVELRLVYWDPLKYRREKRRHGLDNHIPDICYPAWGYKRLTEYDTEIILDDVSVNGISIRRFYKADHEECVLFWYVGEQKLLSKGDLRKRVLFLIDSWKQPFLTHGSQYVVSIVVPVRSSYSAAQKKVIQFAKLIRPILQEYGIN